MSATCEIKKMLPLTSMENLEGNCSCCRPLQEAIQILPPDSYTTPPMLSKEYGLVIIPYWALLYSKCPKSIAPPTKSLSAKC